MLSIKKGIFDIIWIINIVQVAAGEYYTVGLKKNGTLIAMGYNGVNQCDVSSWTDIIKVTAGDSHTVGLKKDGTVIAVGYNNDGRCNVSNWADISQIALGWDYTEIGRAHV